MEQQNFHTQKPQSFSQSSKLWGPKTPWVLRKEEILKTLKTAELGLSQREADKRLKLQGKNILPEKKQLNPILKYLREFNSPLIYILFVAAIISFFLKHMVDVYVILAVVIINATVGFIQERKAEKAIKALKKIIVNYAKVYRDNKLVRIPTKELVTGDIISLEEGDKVPADSRLIEIKNFRTDESSLTGESTPVDKELKILPLKTLLADRINSVYMGSLVSSGTAKAIVTATGSNTEIGKIASSISKIKPEKMHFNKKVDQLAIHMAIIAIIGALATFIIGFFIRGLEFFEVFLFTIASLVSGIPEGLPAVLTIVLAIGAFRMAKRNAVIRHLPSVETLGVATIIATDKTGTLTENSMTVEKILLPSQNQIRVSGKGLRTEGSFIQDNKTLDIKKNKHLQKLLEIITICNNSKVTKRDDKLGIIGDPTEAALIVLAEKAGIRQEELLKRVNKIDDLPFNPELKYRASLSVLIKDKKKEIYSLGAFEDILNLSNSVSTNKQKLTKKQKSEILKQGEELAKQGLRVLGVAYRDMPTYTKNLDESYINNLTFVGLIAMKDPPKSGVKEAIQKAKQAGIRIIMKTGDHKETALAIAKEIGLASNENVLTEDELEKISEKQFKKVVREVDIFARVTPEMKMRIITELQRQGEVVAMTGDGINDAPALKKADIGVSMGLGGTDVAREASEMILSDDNFVSIVNAVEEGRIVFQNTRKTSFFLITTNVAEDITIIASLSLFLPLPLLPIHVLWLNLVTDTGSGLGLAAEPGHDDVLNESPKSKKEKIINMELIPFLLLSAGLMALVTIPLFWYYLPDLMKARTVAFVSMSMLQLFNVFNMRSLKKSIFEIKPFSNKWVNYGFLGSLVLMLIVIYVPFLQKVFQFVSLSVVELLLIVVLSSGVLWLGEIYKWFKRRNLK
ncbi:cation-transporting ATPase [Candidatus Pacearchaeota archaeon]|nr:cation-transporting ATPase [Candidatus Pacearchaeota archaeon]